MKSAEAIPACTHEIDLIGIDVERDVGPLLRSMAQLVTFFVLLATAANLIAYLACALAALTLSATGRMPAGTALRSIFVLAALFSISVLTVAGLRLYAWMRRGRATGPFPA